ncbi:SET domain-containing protein-lysine N-methyltransferase [Candidatus Pacearchaeota archaeon CG10_big_fil_rev_8_21_14_0_10_32_14]|nr:MAG: SET domain-containing protein-lysine N-methyltransferase [Candidatus Pacearchaeota archaeon CG10_big_fil_rev_8_21_14_0_10_32_14]
MIHKKTSSKYIIIKNSSIHSKGIYAKTDIPKNIKVIEYVGKKVSNKLSDKVADRDLDRSKKNKKLGEVYLFELNKEFDIDGNYPYNTARYLNHSCNPNCKYKYDNGKIWIISIRIIKKGEELTFDYDFDLEDYEHYPCLCGSKNCVGFIIGKKYRNKLQQLIQKRNTK